MACLISNLMSVLLTLGLYRETFIALTVLNTHTQTCVSTSLYIHLPPGVTSMRSGSFSLHTWESTSVFTMMHNRCMLNTEQINNKPKRRKDTSTKIFLKPEFKSPWFQSAPYHHNIKISNS